MQVRVLLFAAHREAVGQAELLCHVPDDASAESLYRSISNDHVGLQPLLPFTSFAVNREIVDAGTRLKPGDEVAFLQPLSGG